MAEVNRLTGGAEEFINAVHDIEKKIDSLQTSGTGSIYVEEQLTTADPVTGVETIFGALPDGTYGFQQFVGDTTPPDQPATPTVVGGTSIFEITWNGLDINGATPPADYDRTVVEMTTAADSGIWSEVNYFKAAGRVVVGEQPVKQMRFFRLVSVDTNGNRSLPSGVVSAQLTPYMESAEMTEYINNVEGAIATADEKAVTAQNTAQSAADAAQAAQKMAEDAAKDSGNLIVNGSFEQDFAGWSKENNNGTIDTTVAYDGTKSFYTGTIGCGILQGPLPVTAGQIYRFGFRYKTVAGYPETTSGGLRLQVSRDGGATFTNTVNTSLTEALDWTYHQAEYTVPADVTHIRPRIAFAIMSGSGAWLDSVSLSDVTTIKALEKAATDAQLAADKAAEDARLAAEAAGRAQTAADGKATVWYQDEKPAGTEHAINDIWFDTNDNNKPYRWNGTDWEVRADTTYQGAISGALNTFESTKIDPIRTTVDGKNSVYTQAAKPTGTAYKINDIWYNTSDNNKPNRWNGNDWVSVNDTTYVGALSSFETQKIDPIRSTLDGKNTVYTQGTQPTAPTGGFKKGDLWFDTANKNEPKTWTGTAWVSARDAAIADVDSKLNSTTTSINARIDDELRVVNETLDSELGTVNTRITDDIAAVNTRVTTEISTVNSTLESEITGVENKVNTDIGTVNTRITNEIGTVNDTLATELGEVDTRITNEIGTVNTNITNTETSLTTKINSDISTALTTASNDATKKANDALTAAKTADEVVKAVADQAKIDAANAAAIANAAVAASKDYVTDPTFLSGSDDLAFATLKKNSSMSPLNPVIPAPATSWAYLQNYDNHVRAFTYKVEPGRTYQIDVDVIPSTAGTPTTAFRAGLRIKNATGQWNYYDAKDPKTGANGQVSTTVTDWTHYRGTYTFSENTTFTDFQPWIRNGASSPGWIATNWHVRDITDAQAALTAAANAQAKADAAFTNAATAQGRAEDAETNAIAEATRLANAAELAAKTAAQLDAQSQVEDAEARAADEAARVAQEKADIAEAEALPAAKTHADLVAGNAETAAINAAKIDAESKADAAESAAIEAARLDAEAQVQLAEIRAATEAARVAKEKADQALIDAKKADEAVQKVATDALNLATTKGTTYFQATEPAVDANGIWFDTSKGNLPHRTTTKRALFYSYSSAADLHTAFRSEGWTVTEKTGQTPSLELAKNYDLVIFDGGVHSVSNVDARNAAQEFFNAGISVITAGNDSTSLPGMFSSATTPARTTTEKGVELVESFGTHPLSQGWAGFLENDVNHGMAGVVSDAVVFASVTSNGVELPMAAVREYGDQKVRWIHSQGATTKAGADFKKALADYVGPRWVPAQDAGIQAVADAAAKAQKAAELAAANAVNIVSDPSFESRTTGETLGTLWTVDATTGRTGTKSVKGSAGSNSDTRYLHFANNIAVTPGQTWRFRLWFKTSSDFNGAGAVNKMRISNQNDGVLVAPEFTVSTTWKMLEVEYVVPASGITALNFMAIMNQTVGSVWVDDVEATNITEYKRLEKAATDAQANAITEAQKRIDAAKLVTDAAITEVRTAAQIADDRAREAAGLAGTKGKVWTQGTAPARGATYEWVSSGYGPYAVKKIDGVVTRTNVLSGRNPAALGAHTTVTTGVSFQGKTWARVSATQNTEIRHYAALNAMVQNELYIASVLMHNESDTDFTTNFDIGDRAAGVFTVPARKSVRINSNPTTRTVDATNTGWTEVYRFFDNGLKVNQPQLHTERNLELASTFDPNQPFFDGDTPDEREYDLWINTTEGNRPYRWDRNSKTWVQASDAAIAAAQGVADAAKIAAENAAKQHVNIIPDGSFEGAANGAILGTQGWVVDGTVARTGTKSAKSPATGTAINARYHNIVWKTPVLPGQIWRATAWYKTSSDYNGTSGNGKLRLGDQGNTGLYGLTFLKTTEWAKVTRDYEVPADGSVTHLTLGLGADHFAGTLWVDDVVFTEVSALVALEQAAINAQKVADDALKGAQMAAKSGDNMIVNPTFELGGLGWYGQTNQIVTLPDAYSGTQVFQATATGELFQDGVPTYEGQIWRIEMWYKTEATYVDQSPGGLRLQYSKDNGATWIQGAYSNLNAATVWTQTGLEFKMPAGTTHVRLRLAFAYTGGAKVWVDNMALRNVTDARATAESITAVQTIANSKNIITNATVDPNAIGLTVGDLWWKRDSNGVISGQWEWTGGTGLSGWKKTSYDNAVIANIDAGKINAGTIDAARIGAKSIGVEKLTVGDFTNIVVNPRFEFGVDGLDGWTPNQSGTVVSDAGTLSGKALEIPGTGGYPARYQAKRFPITGGQKLRIKGKTKRSPETTSTQSGSVRVHFYGSYGNSNLGIAATMVNPNTWYDVNGILTAPANTREAVVWVEANTSSPVGSKMWYGDIEVYKMSAGELIVDGAITTDKLDAQAVTAAKIAANAIEADKIAAGAITASKLTISDFENLWTDPNFDQTAFSSSAPVYTGTEVIPNGQKAIQAGFRDMRASQWVAVKAGEQFRITYVAKRIAGTQPLRATVWIVNKDKVSGSWGTPYMLVSNSYRTESEQIADLGNGWARYTTTTKIPTSAAFEEVAFGSLYLNIEQYSPWDTKWLVTDIEWRRMNAGSLIVDGSITSDKVAANAITAAKILAGAIETDKLAANAVVADKIAANAVTATKIAADAVEADKIKANAVTSDKVVAGAIVADKIASNAITSDKIEANAVTAVKIAAGAIEADKIAANAITSGKIDADAITADKIATGAVTADSIAANAVTAAAIEADAITAVKIAAGAVEADKIKANAVTSEKIVAGAVVADKIGANAVTADKIAANAITAVKVAAGSITADKLIIGSGGNLHTDAQMTNALVWQSAATMLEAVGTGMNGGGSIRVAPGTSLRGTYMNFTPETMIPVTPGSTYRASVWARTDGAAPAKAVTMYARAYKSTNIAAGHQWPGADRAEAPAMTANVWTKIEGNFTIPADHDRLAVGFYVQSSFTGAVRYSDVSVQPVVDETLITNGAITTNKIAANAVVADKIAANAVTATKIFSGAVETDKLAANSITASKIQANAVTAEKIAANTVSARELLVADFENLWMDTDFIKGPDMSYAVMYEGTDVPLSKKAIQIGSRDHIGNVKVNVQAGQSYRLTYTSKRIVGTATSLNATMWLTNIANQKGANWSHWSLTSPSYKTTPQLVTDYGNGWARYTTVITIPADWTDVYWGQIYLQLNQFSPYTDTWAVSDLEWRHMNNGSLIVDGAITATKIGAEAVTADKVMAGAIDASKIKANSITSAEIAAGAITADRLQIGDTTNLWHDKDFNEGWYKATKYTGTEVTPNGGGAVQVGETDHYANHRIPVRAGDGFRIRYNAKRLSGTDGINASVWVTNKDNVGGVGWQPWHSLNYDGNGPIQIADLGNGWARYEAVTVLPDTWTDVAWGRLYFQVIDNPDKATSWIINDVEWRRTSGNTLIQNGAITTDKIASRTITSENIATGTITAESGVIGSIDAGKITVGEMDAARLKAGSIQTDRMVVGQGENLVVDPEFSAPATGNHTSARTAGASAGAIWVSPNRIGWNVTTADTTARALHLGGSTANATTPTYPVVPGRTYVITYNTISQAASSTVGTGARVNWISESGVSTTVLATPVASASEIVATNYVKVTLGTSVERRFTITAPADAKVMRLDLLTNGHPGGGRLDFIRPAIRLMTDGTSITGSTITTSHIAANTITGGNLNVSSVQTSIITSSVFSGKSFTGGTWSGDVHNGATFQTVTDANRGVKMTPSGFFAYDGSGNTMVSIDTAGNATFKGNVIVTGGTIPVANLEGTIPTNKVSGLDTLNSTVSTQGTDLSNLSGTVSTQGTNLSNLTGTVNTQGQTLSGVNTKVTSWTFDGTSNINGGMIQANTVKANQVDISAVGSQMVKDGAIQTVVTANRGVKITEAGLSAYNDAGTETIRIGSDGSAMFTGNVTVKDATITGSVFQTHTASNVGIKIDSNGLISYGTVQTGGVDPGAPSTVQVETFRLDANTGNLHGSVNAKIIGGSFETRPETNMGTKIGANGITVYDATSTQASSKVLLDVNVADNRLTMVGQLRTAPLGEPGVIVSGSSASYNNRQLAIWFSPDGTAPGFSSTSGYAGGIWMENIPTISSAYPLTMRGQSGAGVKIYGGLTVAPDPAGTGSASLISSIAGKGLNFRSYGAVDITANAAVEVFGTGESGFNSVGSGNAVWLRSHAGNAWVKGDARVYLESNTGGIVFSSQGVTGYKWTSSSAANMYINGDGVIFRSTSSIRYKKHISDYRPNIDNVLKLQPRKWRDRKQDNAVEDMNYYYGFIAEEVEKLFPELVTYVIDEKTGQKIADGLQYDRFATVLVEKIKDQEKTIDDLEARLQRLEQRMV